MVMTLKNSKTSGALNGRRAARTRLGDGRGVRLGRTLIRKSSYIVTTPC